MENFKTIEMRVGDLLPSAELNYLIDRLTAGSHRSTVYDSLMDFIHFHLVSYKGGVNPAVLDYLMEKSEVASEDQHVVAEICRCFLVLSRRLLEFFQRVVPNMVGLRIKRFALSHMSNAMLDRLVVEVNYGNRKV